MATPEEIQGALAAAGIIHTISTQYPEFAGIFQAVPELRPILIDAVTQDWDPTKLENAVHETNWWKTTPESQRLWQVQQVVDPAQAAQKRTQTVLQYYQIAAQEGVSVPLQTMATMVDTGIAQNWDDQQIRQAIIDKETNGDPRTGEIDATRNTLATTASDYGLPLGDNTLYKWAKDIRSGRSSTDAFQAYAESQAKSMFPGLAHAIDSGVTVKQYFDPYAQTAAQTLGINPADINLTDTKWRAPLQQKTKDGTFQPMSLADWSTELMTNPQYSWDQSRDAQNAATNLITQLGQAFGRVG